MPQVGTTDCSVLIVAPGGAQWRFGAAGHARTHGGTFLDGLLAVETEKDLRHEVGGFTLTFDALADAEGRTWAQRIPMRSLVFIVMDRPGAPGVSTVNPTVMVGLTDSHQTQEAFSEAQPRRAVQLHGREVSCVILDAQLFFHPQLAANPAYGTLTLHSEAQGELQMALTANPLLVTPMEPREILRLILNTYLFVGGEAPATTPVTGSQPGPAPPPTPAPASGTPIPQAPLLSINLPDRHLRDVLVLNADAWSTFEEPLRVARTPFPARTGSLSNYLHLFFDRAFQEFFTRVEDGVCKIHFRGKPFRHALVRSGTRFKSPEEEPTLQTFTLDPGDVLARQLGTDSSNVQNYFVVLPRGLSDMKTGPFYRTYVVPQVVTDPTHPSFVGRYGLRIYHVDTVFLNAAAPAGPAHAVSQPVAQPLKPPGPHAEPYATMANRLAAEERLPVALRPWFVANIQVESNFNPQAQSKKPDGTVIAQGIAQFTPGTATEMGLTNPFDPVESLRKSAQYWNKLRAYPWIGDDPRLIAAAYNAGPFAVRDHKGVPPFAETQTHVRRVEAAMPRYHAMAGTTPAPPPASPAPATPAAAPAAAEHVQDDIIATCQRWGAILRAWYDMGGELFGGTITVRGHPAWNIGHRLLSRDQRGEWEAYIEGVRHRYDIRTGQYLTTLRVTRGWYLSDAVATQIAEEGRTPITTVSGGPPEIDPAGGRGDVTMTRARLDGVWYVFTEDGDLVPEPSPPKE